MTLGNKLDELIPTSFCSKSLKAVPGPSGIDLVTFPSLRESGSYRMFGLQETLKIMYVQPLDMSWK